jgi:predicted nuclease of predicted toxin-antitoxin system
LPRAKPTTPLLQRNKLLLLLVDAQLPPSLADALRQAGCQASHVADIGLLTATDQQIWDEAVSRSAVLVTKDRDFPQLRATRIDGPVILWIRVGNSDNKTLISKILHNLPVILNAAERGETVIEFVAR